MENFSRFDDVEETRVEFFKKKCKEMTFDIKEFMKSGSKVMDEKSGFKNADEKSGLRLHTIMERIGPK